MTRQERMALALAYQQRNRPNLGDLSPEQVTAMQAPTQQPTMSLLDRISETGAGIGKGLANTVEGMGQMVTAPIETGKEMYRNVSDVVSNPSLIVDALKQMGEKATSSPAGFGEVVGENINPRNLLKTFTHPKIRSIVNDVEKNEKITLHRAANDTDVNAGTSFAEDKNVAKMYTNNSGFGGSNLYEISIPSGKVLDLTKGNPWKEIALHSKIKIDPNDYDNYIDRVLPTENYGIAEALEKNGFDWVKLHDSYPSGSITWQPVSQKAVWEATDAMDLFEEKKANVKREGKR